MMRLPVNTTVRRRFAQGLGGRWLLQPHRTLATTPDPKWVETTFAPRLFEKLHLSSFSKEELEASFDEIDKDKSGFIDQNELKQLLETMHVNKAGSSEIRQDHVEAILEYFGSGGRISREEFEQKATLRDS